MLIIQLRHSNVFRPGVTKAQEQSDKQYGMGVGVDKVTRGDITCLVYFLFIFFVENIKKMLLYIPQISSQLSSWLEKCRCSLQSLKTPLASAARRQVMVMFLPCLWVEAVIPGACESNSHYALSSDPLIEESQHGMLWL